MKRTTSSVSWACCLAFRVGLLILLMAGPLLPSTWATPTAIAAVTVLLDFEGLATGESVSNYYNGGTGGNGTGPGPNLGVTFSPNALAIIDWDAGGSGDFGGEPSPDTAMYFEEGGVSTLDFPAGFETQISLFYSAAYFSGSITLYDGPGATGNVLAVLSLPVTPTDGGDPNGSFSPFFPIAITFEGIARSVDFAGSVNAIVFDNIELGSDAPPTPTPTPTPTATPSAAPTATATATPTAIAVHLLEGRVTVGAVSVLQNTGGTVRLEQPQLSVSGHQTFFVPEPRLLWQLGSGVGMLALFSIRRRRVVSCPFSAVGS